MVVVVAAVFVGVDPSTLLALLNADQPPQPTQTQTRPADEAARGPATARRARRRRAVPTRCGSSWPWSLPIPKTSVSAR
jgi:uncharacterized protein (DUF2336 family)